LQEILEFMGATGPPGFGDGEALLERRLAAYTTEGEPYLERLPDRHMVVEVRANRMPGGGLVITFSDVTPSFEAAEALERANATLEKRVRDRTEELTRLNSELALAKSTAEDASNSKTRFLAAASHDILQPLNADARIRGSWKISTIPLKRSRRSLVRSWIFPGSMPAP
jgi:signal transduction histidine kinase